MKTVVNKLDTRTELKKAIDLLNYELPNQIELIALQAKLAKAQYSALLENGFTEKESLEIITKQPFWR